MRAVHCLLGILQLLSASQAAKIPAPAVLVLSNSTGPSDELGARVPAAPYKVRQDDVFLTFHDYGAPLTSDTARRLVLRAMNSIIKRHGIDSDVEIGRKVAFSLKLPGQAETLGFMLEPEANMTWGMFATATIGVTRFLERWDNVEFAVDVDMRMDGGGKVGTAYLNTLDL